MKKAVCLLSGGLDSTTCLYHAKNDGYEVIALTVDYGQLHEKEILFACNTAKKLEIKHYQTKVDLPWGGSALLDKQIDIPVGRDEEVMNKEIPSTYVPARNSVFLSLASSLAEAEGAEIIFIGANVLDYSGYPDCRPEYLESFSKMIELGTKVGSKGKAIKIAAPLLRMNKKEIIEHANSLKVPFEMTWSCYKGEDVPCGECDSCKLRAKGFAEANMSDPLIILNSEL